MPLAKWWSRLTDAECAECGYPVPVFARVCPQCGAGNRSRVAAFAVVASLAVLAVVITVVAIVVLRWERLPSDAGTEQAAAPSAAAGDFAWLTTAMQECDAVAAKEPDTLHFLVIPLTAVGGDEAAWRAKALNRIGNAILLRSDAALDGLKSGTLSISKNAYVFAVRDQASVTYDWDRTVGVAKFSIPNVAAVESFSVQFQATDKPSTDDWGSAFTRQKGNCYWVNAILSS